MELRTHYMPFLTQSLAHSRCSSLDSHLFKKVYIVDDALISSSAVVCASFLALT